MSEQSADGTDRPPYREFPGEIWELMAEEWHDRTWFGKLVYPLWVLNSLIWWMSMIGFFGAILLTSRIVRCFESSDSSGSSLLEVNKDE